MKIPQSGLILSKTDILYFRFQKAFGLKYLTSPLHRTLKNDTDDCAKEETDLDGTQVPRKKQKMI